MRNPRTRNVEAAIEAEIRQSETRLYLQDVLVRGINTAERIA